MKHLTSLKKSKSQMIGFVLWLEFMKENNVIDENLKEELQEKAYIVLEKTAKNQANDVEDEDPIKDFFKTIGELQIAEKVYFIDYKTGLPIDKNTGTHIGYIDNENNQYYLIADVTYKEVSKACLDNFLATPKQLWNALAEEGYSIRIGNIFII